MVTLGASLRDRADYWDRERPPKKTSATKEHFYPGSYNCIDPDNSHYILFLMRG